MIQKTQSVVLSLPDKKSAPKESMLEYSYLIYGRKKIGKTTFAAQFPDAIFLMTEPGAENLRVYQVPVKNWKEFKGYLDLLDNDRKRFKTTVVDIGDPLYDMCMEYVCDKEGIDHPSENKDFGKTWKEVTKEFQKQLSRLLPMNSGRGLVVLSHEKVKEIDVIGEDKPIERIIPTMEKHTLEFFNGKVDVIAYYCFKKQNRWITIKGDEFLEAGCRLEENFLTTDGEQRLVRIPGGKTSKETFQNFKLAFENNLPEAISEAQGGVFTEEKIKAEETPKKSFKRIAPKHK